MKMHKQWRKIAKRERRRRIRTNIAKAGECLHMEVTCETGDIEEWLRKQEELEQHELDQIKQLNIEENNKWLQAEAIAMEQWRQLQEKKRVLLLKQQEQEAKIKLEWEMEKRRKEKEAQRIKCIEEANKKKQQDFIHNLGRFIKGDSDMPPPELLILHETKPNADLCPFFSKTACCRFGDDCSRNHQYPGISKVLLATNFYTHFGLDNANNNEYDTDVMLEYEDTETYRGFKDFFYDILPEFEKFGKICQLKVCNNYEKHLRGNTYVEYVDLRNAVAAYRALHTRWYGGKQLSLQFCEINSWKNAICGLQSKNRCPKGRACNFLHVFRNPNNLFNGRNPNSTPRTPVRSRERVWRWSESPERERHTESRRDPRDSDRKHKTISRSSTRSHRSHRRSSRSKN